MAEKAIYLGFNINKNGVSPVKEKIENKRTTKEPRTVAELKSFLGLKLIITTTILKTS